MYTDFYQSEFAANDIACWGYDNARHRQQHFVVVFGIDGWLPAMKSPAVTDDFGTLVKVEAR